VRTRRALIGLALGGCLALLASCGGGAKPSGGAVSSSPSSSKSSAPVPASYGIVLVGLTSPTSHTYTVSLFDTHGRTVARATAHFRTIRSLDSSSNTLPEVSASSDRVYFLDGDSTLKWLMPDGSTGLAATLPGSRNTEVAFAVSPDNSRIAVTEFAFGASGRSTVTENLYVSDLTGGRRTNLSRTTVKAASSVEWPIGWHAQRLVLQRGLLFNQYPDGYGSMAGYVVLDTSSGHRVASICSSQQQVWGTPSATGVICVGSNYSVRGWDNQSIFSSAACSPFSPALSPDGTRWAGRPVKGSSGVCQNTKDPVTLYARDSASKSTRVHGDVWGWLDATHIVINDGSRVDQVTKPFRILEVEDGSVSVTSLVGFFVGTLPGELG
jgi:hypothetical protein